MIPTKTAPSRNFAIRLPFGFNMSAPSADGFSFGRRGGFLHIPLFFRIRFDKSRRLIRAEGACFMKGDPAERALEIGEYIVRSGATVRAAARVFGVSKSTVWKDQARLKRQNQALWREVQTVLQKNKAERHLRGGEATRQKYLHTAQKTEAKPCMQATRQV